MQHILTLEKIHEIMFDLNLSKQTQPSTDLRLFNWWKNFQEEILSQIYQELLGVCLSQGGWQENDRFSKYTKLGDFVDVKSCVIKIEQVLGKGNKFQ